MHTPGFFRRYAPQKSGDAGVGFEKQLFTESAPKNVFSDELG